MLTEAATVPAAEHLPPAAAIAESRSPVVHHHRLSRAVTRALATPPLRLRSCGKRWYADRIAADLSLALIRARGPALSEDPVRSYLCPGRGGWHLTSTPTWRSATICIPRQRTASSSVEAAR